MGNTQTETDSSKAVETIARNARLAGQRLAAASLENKNKALEFFKQELLSQKDAILAANKNDMEAAKIAVDAGKLSPTLFKRLDLSGEKYNALITGIDDIIKMEDPVGKVTYANEMSDGLKLYRTTCPIGVLTIIFEARPEAAVQIACLALKSGNALLLKGGKEAANSNAALAETMRAALAKMDEASGVCSDAIQLVDTREGIAGLLKMDKYVDLIIPRGSNDLVRYIKDNTTIPVLGHADGICAVYVDKDADLEKAVRIVVDAKTQYAAACNAVETLLVHQDIAAKFLPMLEQPLREKEMLKFHADETCLPHLPADLTVAAVEEDFSTEFLSHTLAVKAVASAQEAIDHINDHSSQHTESIVTENKVTAELFMDRIDSANVYHNCSTRFADGFRYGFGAEVGISTNRIHSRGPVGLDGLVIYKYRMYGDGHVVADFKPEGRQFHHRAIPSMATVENIKAHHA